jgi:hypothetical protein
MLLSVPCRYTLALPALEALLGKLQEPSVVVRLTEVRAAHDQHPLVRTKSDVGYWWIADAIVRRHPITTKPTRCYANTLSRGLAAAPSDS